MFGDVYQVIMKGLLLGQATVNVFYYQETDREGTPAAAQGLAQSFENLFGLEVGNGVFNHAGFIASWQYFSLDVKNLFDPTELFTILNGGTNLGAATGERMPPFVSYRFIHPRERSDMRQGQKFFPGVPETYGLDGTVNSTVIALMSELVTALGSDILSDQGESSVTFSPIILKRVFDPTLTTKSKYRLPEDQSEVVRYFANTWTFVPELTTMNTRKKGRGI